MPSLAAWFLSERCRHRLTARFQGRSLSDRCFGEAISSLSEMLVECECSSELTASHSFESHQIHKTWPAAYACEDGAQRRAMSIAVYPIDCYNGEKVIHKSTHGRD